MQVVHERCCGLDVHEKVVAACVVTQGERGAARKEQRAFGTMTEDLERLAEWLTERGVTHVAMESTGSYWKPIWNVLEDRFALVLANAQHVKRVPGRKTDVKDAEWLAELLRHGLIQGSFVPDRPQRELRGLTRYRTSLVEERTAAVNRLQKVLEGANVKLASVATDVTGVSARAMLTEIVAGSTDATALAQGRLREKIPALQRALAGRVGPHQRFLFAQQLAHVDFLDEQIARLDVEVAERTRPFEDVIAQLDTIPGVSRRIACRDSGRRDRGRDGPFPDAGPPRLMGGDVPRQRRERRQAPQRQDAQGQPGVASRADPGRPRRRPYQGDLPRRPVPPPSRPARRQEGHDRRWPLHPHHRLLPAHPLDHLPGPRPLLLRRARPRRRPPSTRRPPGKARLQSHHRTNGRLMGEVFRLGP